MTDEQSIRWHESRQPPDDSQVTMTDERTRLLPAEHGEETGPREDSSENAIHWRTVVFRTFIYGLFATLVEAGVDLESAPLKAVLETNICDNLYHGRPDKMSRCGADEDVQGKLAEILGWMAMFTLVPG